MDTNTRIAIVDYDPRWPELFRREADGVRAVLGNRVLRMEHTGSTPVPGLAAKPIIDITLAVADSADEEAYVPALEGAGYVLRIREPDWHEHRMPPAIGCVLMPLIATFTRVPSTHVRNDGGVYLADRSLRSRLATRPHAEP